MAEPPGVLPCFDRAEFAARFGAELHRAGVVATPERSVRFVEALRLLPPVDRAALYWAARLAYVTGREQIAPFDRIFALVFGGLTDPAGPRGDSANPPLPGLVPGPPAAPDSAGPPPRPADARLPGGAAQQEPDADRPPRPEPPEGTDALRLIGSSDETLAHKDFGSLRPGELAELDRLLDALVPRLPLRRTRRREADPRGRRVDLRRSLRQSLRTGGETLRLARSHGRLRRRPLVLLCDISGSMEPYTRAYLRFFSRVGSRAGSGVAAEIFVFATRLTRLTPVLRHATPDAALRRAGRTAPDWSGGTLIARALAEFLGGYGRRGMARGAVVVVFSDGWEGEDPAAVGREMARLSLLAHRVVWVNPRKAAPGYAPLTGGMAAALPYCDAFVSGHSAAALAEVVEAIAGEDGGRRHGQPGRSGRSSGSGR
ncbi:VWA domain-containing protein [Streptacidiphilus sp. PB12-B1b]|uniref:vWA domain-containing protein n=1 Tax=Streptacidiphilus sp. PB12-B1b TaxID=2705012 RepID=UPI0015F8A884|nr:VWA domain-containing protein [Streptacidiphilus sp. PB12-B1b]QMU77865.1 VWA domain-containing protein [Streptacidiphilus sp. PB12-B1b]